MQGEEVYLWKVSTAEGNTNAKREHNTWPVGKTYQVQMSGTCTKKGFQMPWWRGWGEVWTTIRLGKQIYLLVVLIFYNDISQCFYCSFYLH